MLFSTDLISLLTYSYCEVISAMTIKVKCYVFIDVNRQKYTHINVN